MLDSVEGHSLAAVLEQLDQAGDHLPVQGVLQLGQQLCAGLAHAHDATDEAGRPLGLVHGDLSPANVLLRADGVLKITDFGAARSALDPPGGPPPRGTPGFGAPELARGRCDARADLYAVGALLQALLARVPEATWPTKLAPLLASTLAEDRTARPDSAQRLGDALTALRAGLPPLREGLPHFNRSWVMALRTLSGESSPGTPPPTPARPFRGLEAFGAASATLFFGREDDARRLAERVRQSALVVLTGASGAGKSSLLAAGLPSHLADFAIVSCRLGPDPVASLARALAPGDGPSAEALQARPEAGASILAHRLTARTVLVVDQAETLITLAETARHRDAAAAILADLVARGSLRAVLAVRGPVAEPAHEALAAHWRRLDGWVARDAEAQRLLEELGAAAQVWARRHRDAHLLWRGDLLVHWRRHAGDLRERLSPRDAEFVDAALRHERGRRRRRVAAVLGSWPPCWC